MLILVFFISSVPPLYAASMVSDFLCEIGINFYKLGRYDEALHEFRKALIVQPNYEPALRYIRMIEQMQGEVKEEILPALRPTAAPAPEVIKKYLDLIQIQREMIKERKISPYQPQITLPKEIGLKGKAPVLPEKMPEIKILTLDESFYKIKQPIEIEKGLSMIIRGKNIQRFLVTQPDIITVERKSSDELLVTGKDIGYTYLHVWDDSGRRTLEFLTVFPEPKRPTAEEEMLLQEEREGTFKLRYSVEWSSYEQGRRLYSLKRQYYSWEHSLTLTGSTPYGKVDSTALVRSLRESTDLTYLTLGLIEGKFGPFKDFTLRGADFGVPFSNLSGGGGSGLRGAMVQSPAFNKKIDYTAFWGRESGGRYGKLSPGLLKSRHSFLDGADINYNPGPGYNYGVSVIHGYGRDRLSYLNNYAYDADANWHLGKWAYRYEIGYDTETFAHLFSSNFIRPKLRFTYELRNIEKNFLSINGGTWRRGELGGIFNLNLRPSNDWDIRSRLDVYQDRLFPSPENDNRWNEDYDFNARYTIDPTATLRMNYTFQNELGKISQSRYQNVGTGLSKSFNFIRKINSFIDYRHQERKNYSSPSMDYINESISTGIRFNLIRQLYYFLNQQWNWLEERYNGNRSTPHAFETGVDLSSQIFNSPFYENISFRYRNEGDAESGSSFLSGEDYIEGYTELSYRPNPGTEAYCSSRIRNVWPGNTGVNKRIEADFNIGMRYLWDTGVRWESVGSIEGYVFRDLNADGLRQRDEAPVQGIKILLGKDKTAITDEFGYYKFGKVKGKRAFVVLDIMSLPSGFVLTVPQRQEVAIKHSQTVRADFGIISRSEISGIVFYDANDDGEYNRGDVGIKDAVLTLEDGKRVTTQVDGTYSIRNASVGEHKITLDLNSLPPEYLPKVPMVKEMTLFEGLTYIYNIPLKKIKK